MSNCMQVASRNKKADKNVGERERSEEEVGGSVESTEACDGCDDEEVGAQDHRHQQRRQHQQSRIRHLPMDALWRKQTE